MLNMNVSHGVIPGGLRQAQQVHLQPYNLPSLPSVPVVQRRGQCVARNRHLPGQDASRLVCSSQTQTTASAGPRFIQHKDEAKTFYRFLSIV